MSSIAAAAPDDAGASKGGSRLARSAGIIGLATMASRLLGLVREQVLAYYFGAGNAMDLPPAFYKDTDGWHVTFGDSDQDR